MTAASPASTLRELVTRSDSHPALLVPESGAGISYAALQRALDRATGRLAAVGVAEGDRVGLVAANGPAMILAFLAIAARGAVVAPLNPALSAAEMTAELEDLRVSRLLHEGAATAVTAAADAGVPAGVIGMQDEFLHIDGEPGQPSEADGTATPDSLALLLHTSGTTSKPKTVPIRQRNLVATTGAIAQTYALTSEDVTMCVMPLFHVHGLVATVLATLSTGGTVVLPRFRPSTFWDEAARHRATWYTAVPTIHARLLAQAQQAPVKHQLRFVRSCSAPLPTVLWQRYEEAVGVPLVEAYGMTEAAHQMASNPLPPRERRAGTVGLATGIEIAALDDDWQPVPAGTEGEVAVRGPSVVDEYLGNPEATAASFRDGWFRTGDVGKLSADGYLTLVGRLKELINRAGEKISPYEVEEALLAHPAVAEAAAYPVPDEKYGETVGVVVVLRDDGAATPKELSAYCADRLAAFKRPARVTILPGIPKGPTGKIQRRNLSTLVER